MKASHMVDYAFYWILFCINGCIPFLLNSAFYLMIVPAVPFLKPYFGVVDSPIYGSISWAILSMLCKTIIDFIHLCNTKKDRKKYIHIEFALLLIFSSFYSLWLGLPYLGMLLFFVISYAYISARRRNL